MEDDTGRKHTAGAAKKVHEEGDLTQAAIASREAGRLFGLVPLEENICHNGKNVTRFIIVREKIRFIKRMPERSAYFLNCPMRAELCTACFLTLFITV